MKRWFHVYARDGEVLARCTYPHHSAVLALALGEGTTIAYRGKALYTTPAGERYDGMERATELGEELRRLAYGNEGGRDR